MQSAFLERRRSLRKVIAVALERSMGILAAVVTLVPISTLDAASMRTAFPPSSVRPDIKTQAVRVSHRHRSIAECIHVAVSATCVGRVADADTGTSLTFERAGVANAALDGAHGRVRVVFPHLRGAQQQLLALPIGDWVVDWPGNARLERLSVRAGTRTEVALATISGACELKAGHCELIPGVRERRIRISDSN
jgi:hypothetical protein